MDSVLLPQTPLFFGTTLGKPAFTSPIFDAGTAICNDSPFSVAWTNKSVQVALVNTRQYANVATVLGFARIIAGENGRCTTSQQ
jgi:hypothetical protein